MNHTPRAGSIIRLVDQQSSTLTLCYGCPSIPYKNTETHKKNKSNKLIHHSIPGTLTNKWYLKDKQNLFHLIINIPVYNSPRPLYLFRKPLNSQQVRIRTFLLMKKAPRERKLKPWKSLNTSVS